MVIQLIEWYRWSISEMSLNSHILRLGAFRVSIWQEGVSVDVIYTWGRVPGRRKEQIWMSTWIVQRIGEEPLVVGNRQSWHCLKWCHAWVKGFPWLVWTLHEPIQAGVSAFSWEKHNSYDFGFDNSIILCGLLEFAFLNVKVRGAYVSGLWK